MISHLCSQVAIKEQEAIENIAPPINPASLVFFNQLGCDIITICFTGQMLNAETEGISYSSHSWGKCMMAVELTSNCSEHARLSNI